MSDINLLSDAIYIDPTNCDSQVSYKINYVEYGEGADKKKSLNASVLLSDCSRRIDWYFNGDEDSLEKIDKAIGMLNVFRRNLKAQIHLLKKTGGK
jgi:hypothetical protein